MSWCKIECIADGLMSVGVASEQAPPPPLTILSLSIKTLINMHTKTKEVGGVNYYYNYANFFVNVYVDSMHWCTST